MGSPWAKLTPYYFNLDSEGEVQAAVPLLLYAARQIEGQNGRHSYLMPSEDSAREMVEGARFTVQVSRVERDPTARRKCIELFGTCCNVCGFDFGRIYGELGSGFIHVHHLNPLAGAKGQRKVDPKADLRPVCPNCHEMLHRQNPPVTIEVLKARILGIQN
jgi:predicted HNH restriction endonuclease